MLVKKPKRQWRVEGYNWVTEEHNIKPWCKSFGNRKLKKWFRNWKYSVESAKLNFDSSITQTSTLIINNIKIECKVKK